MASFYGFNLLDDLDYASCFVGFEGTVVVNFYKLFTASSVALVVEEDLVFPAILCFFYGYLGYKGRTNFFLSTSIMTLGATAFFFSAYLLGSGTCY